MSDSQARKTFFRQSGWMTFAVVAGGVFNMGSNFVAQRVMDGGQWNEYSTALSALGLMAMPAFGLQASFASQAAVADSEAARRRLTGTMRGALGLMGGVWLLMVGWWLLRHEALMRAYQLSNPISLWLVLFACLAALFQPVPLGVLQGRQDFLWFGWGTLLNGLGRFVVLVAIVRGLKGGAMGGLAGVLAGNLAVLGMCLWRTRALLTAPRDAFEWRPWLRRLAPVTIGLGALTFVTQADAVIVREYVRPQLTDAEAGGYSAVRTIGLAMIFLVTALTSVMYPKVARSLQRAEQTDALRLTILLTAAIGVGGAALATVWPVLPLRLLSPPEFWASKTLVPWFCWAMVPMSLASVLIWSLLARECYRSVPWLAVVALGYYVALLLFHDSLLMVIEVMGVFGILLLAVCMVFLWLDRRRHLPGPEAQPAQS